MQLFCEVQPVQSENLVYQWMLLASGRIPLTFSGQRYNVTFSSETLRFTMFFCSVTLNQKQIGSAVEHFEVHGK